ncbi:MAG: D-xylose ABC transporter, ATP-binding protein XylG [Ktedonobacterales bacterium]|jgi:D-xylose transport system ATP-binding protein|nr:MAG: D-xylose ABC transporter, ATP-binding protein XylG [Ktedonobacterales bacterium]
MEPILQLRGVNKSFGAVQALRNVDFEVYAGEVVGLVGDNGAGKSTLIKIVAGVYSADSGNYLIDGRRVSVSRPQDANHLGIETVYQDLALCDNLDVVSNLFLGREETVNNLPFMSSNEMERRTIEVLHQLDVKIRSVRAPVATLSGGQRQSIAVAKTILRNARMVILDEPTAALGVAQTKQVLNLIKRLRSQGLGVVVISHNLADVFEVVDRVIVMRLGRRVASFDIKSTTTEQVVAAITGAEFSDNADSRGGGVGPATTPSDDGSGNGNAQGHQHEQGKRGA